MTLATHAIAGAALATLVPSHPILGFALGFAAHFPLDALPHYDYPIFSDAINPKEPRGMPNGSFLRRAVANPGALLCDVADFSLDAAVGVGVSVLFFSAGAPLVAILCGALGGILPDPLQFVSKIAPYEPLNSLQRFHQWIHTPNRLRETGALALGIVSQLALVGFILFIRSLL
ncbi:MAG: hypothetical protein ACREGH_00935 [Minisyncoccia bacterium]